MGKPWKAAAAAHTFFMANPSHLEMRNNIEKYRRMPGVTEDAFHDRERELEKHWVRQTRGHEGICIWRAIFTVCIYPSHFMHLFLHDLLWETQEVFDAALAAESSSDWARAVQRWKECVNETLKQTDECRAQCVVTSQLLPEETDNIEGAYEKAAGERKLNRQINQNECV